MGSNPTDPILLMGSPTVLSTYNKNSVTFSESSYSTICAKPNLPIGLPGNLLNHHLGLCPKNSPVGSQVNVAT
ncbi:MAG: hypothetical protein ACJ70W_05425 [Nitrososphaera sp.]